MTRRYNKNDRTSAGYGAWQSNAARIAGNRKTARQHGEIPPVEYQPVNKALEALG